MAKRTPESDRRRLIEEQRRKARAKERRTTVVVIVVCTLLAGGIIAAAIYGAKSKKSAAKAGPLGEVGVAADAAGCLEPKSEEIPKDASSDATKHTARDGDHVDYAQSPPTSGRHNPTPLPAGVKKFYSRDENPPPERAVHNLEHAYTVVWYDKKVTEAQIDTLKQAAESAEGKFLIVPWDRADFPDDKHVVLTAWGERQQCAEPSGAVFAEFMEKFGGNNGKAPEKAAF